MMKKTMLMLVCALAVGCSKDDKPSCEAVFEHTKKLAPAEMREMFEQNKKEALENCSKMSDGAKKCALAAKSLEELQKCPRS